MSDVVADTLAELSEYLELDGQPGHASAYSRAADTIRRVDHIPPNPANIDGIGPSLRDAVIDIQHSGSTPLLDELRRVHPYYEELRTISGVGPVLARNLAEMGIESIHDVEQAIGDGSILDVDGIGPRTAENIERNL